MAGRSAILLRHLVTLYLVCAVAMFHHLDLATNFKLEMDTFRGSPIRCYKQVNCSLGQPCFLFHSKNWI